MKKKLFKNLLIIVFILNLIVSVNGVSFDYHQKNNWKSTETSSNTSEDTPTELPQSSRLFQEELEFNSTVTKYYYTISSDSYNAWINHAVYVAVDNNLDLAIRTVIYDTQKFSGTELNFSNPNSIGEDEVYYIQPFSNPDLYGKTIGVEVSSVGSSSGFAEFNYIMKGNSDILSQSKDNDQLNLNISALDLIALNYSTGANIELIFDIINPIKSVFDAKILVFGTEGNHLNALKQFKLSQDNETSITINIGEIISTNIDGLTLIVISQIYEESQYIVVKSTVHLPEFNGVIWSHNQEKINLDVGSSEPTILAIETGSFAVGISIEGGNTSLDHQMSQSFNFNVGNSFDQQKLEKYSTTTYAIQDFGDHVLANPIGYHWYFIKFEINQTFSTSTSITIYIEMKNSPESIFLEDKSYHSTLEKGEFFMKFISLSSYPLNSIIWANPSDTLDVMLYLYKSTGGSNQRINSTNFGIGENDGFGNLDTSTQTMYVLLVQAINGSGTVSLDIQRSEADDTNPSIISVDFESGFKHPYKELIQINVFGEDNLDILNLTIYYRLKGAESIWRSTGVGSSTSINFNLDFGIWEIKLAIFDVSENSVLLDNNTDYYTFNQTDEYAPTLKNLSANFQPGYETKVTMEIEDDRNTIDQVVLAYKISSVYKNVTTDTLNEGNYSAVVPILPTNSSVELIVYATDSKGNWLISRENYFFVGTVDIELSNITFNNTMVINQVGRVEFNAISNEPISTIEIYYTYTNEGIIGGFEKEVDKQSDFFIDLSFAYVGEVDFYLNITTLSGVSEISQNFSIQVIEKTDNAKDDETSTSDTNNEVLPEDTFDNIKSDDRKSLVWVGVLSTVLAVGMPVVYLNKNKLSNFLSTLRNK